ncbi:MAG: serine/threonine-protein kinase [Actinomycetota bacterium]
MIVDGFDDIVRVGAGGLGDVYRARRTSTDTVVAIKELHTGGDLADRQRRIDRELRALASLRGHPNVINLEEVVRSEDDELLLVMEYSPGGSLEDRSAALDGMLPVAEVVLVAQHASAALVAAHGAGIVHRDIKPQNLLVGAYGSVKVCDFGIASVTTADDTATKTDAVSYRYASPEELRGDATVSAAVDVYSLGVSLAKLLTNRYFTHETAVHLEAVDATPGRAGIDASGPELALRSLLRRCLAHRPGRRPTAAQLVDEFDRIALDLGDDRMVQLAHIELPTRIEEPVVAGPTSRRRRSVRTAWAIAIAIWIVVAVLAVLLVTSDDGTGAAGTNSTGADTAGTTQGAAPAVCAGAAPIAFGSCAGQQGVTTSAG